MPPRGRRRPGPAGRWMRRETSVGPPNDYRVVGTDIGFHLQGQWGHPTGRCVRQADAASRWETLRFAARRGRQRLAPYVWGWGIEARLVEEMALAQSGRGGYLRPLRDRDVGGRYQRGPGWWGTAPRRRRRTGWAAGGAGDRLAPARLLGARHRRVQSRPHVRADRLAGGGGERSEVRVREGVRGTELRQPLLPRRLQRGQGGRHPDRRVRVRPARPARPRR